MSKYNPASLRVKERSPSTVDIGGIVTLVLPSGTVTDLGRGAVLLALMGGLVPFEPTQDGSNSRLFTIPGTDTWIASSIRMYWNGQRLQTSLLTIGGAGNRTIILDPSVGITLGDYGVMEGEGLKV